MHSFVLLSSSKPFIYKVENGLEVSLDYLEFKCNFKNNIFELITR